MSTIIRPQILRHSRTLMAAAIIAASAMSSPLLAANNGIGTSNPNASPQAQKGDHILISDQYNNRVIEVDRATHAIVWQFGDGSDAASANSVVGPNDAERFGQLTLITGTGLPADAPAGCSDTTNGCPDNRVFIVNRPGHIIWQYGEVGVAGADANQLDIPVHSVIVPGFLGNDGLQVMITDQGNQRVIVVNRDKQIVWQYGTTGVAGNADNQLSDPNSAEFLDNGNVLIADEGNNRVIEVTTDGAIVATFTAGGTVSGAAFASRLPNGNTLIADANNSRAVEVDPTDAVVWEYATNTETGSNTSPLPTRAVRLANGNTLIADQLNHRVIEVTPDKQIVFTQGQLNMPGNGDNLLNGPYDAKAINDFTGLTNPKGAGDDEEEVDDQGSDQGRNSQGNQGQSNQGQHSQSQNGPNHNGPNQG